MIDLQVIVDRLLAETDIQHVTTNEAKNYVDLKRFAHVLVGRSKSEGLDDVQVSVCRQRMSSRIVIQTIAKAPELRLMRNKTLNVLNGFQLDYYGAEMKFEEGEAQEISGDTVIWVDVYRVEWVWDTRGGDNETGGPWGN